MVRLDETTVLNIRRDSLVSERSRGKKKENEKENEKMTRES